MRRGSVSSWEPWARRNSANMAQIAPTRSEFMTSDLGLTNIEYKRKGGCFLSHKRTAIIIVMFIIGVITAGVIGAYFSPWIKNRDFTALPLAEEDEIDGLITPANKFLSSTSIQPILYTIKLTPLLEEGTVKKFSGHVIVRFNYNSTEPLSRLVLNAKGITVSKAKLLSLDDHAISNVRSRKRRDDDSTVENLNSNGIESSVTYTTESATYELGSEVLRNSSSSEDALNATAIDSTINDTTFINSSIDNISTTPVEIVTLDNETSFEKGDSILTESSDQPLIVQKISPVIPSRPMYPEIFIQSTEILISKDEIDTVGSFYVIYPDTLIQKGIYSLEITYEAKVDEESTFVNVYELDSKRRWLLASMLKPLGPRTLFPSFYDPNSKARFNLSVARPKVLIALANMPLESSEPISDDWVIDNFEISPPLSSSNLAFIVGDLKAIRETTAGDSTIPLTLWGRNSKIEETHFIAEKMDTAIQTLNQFFSTPYTMPKLDVVAIPGLLVDGRGSTGLISIRESLFYITDESSLITKELAVKNLVKVIGEQWLGGLVSAKTLSDAWILEGSLIFLQNLLAEKIDPTLDSADFFGSIQHDALESDSYEVSSRTLDSKISPAILETTYPQNANRKGACLIRMLHNVISDSGFRNGYKKFISRWINGSAGVSDFWKSMSDEAQWLPDGVSLDQVMRSWVGQGGFPVITVERNYESGTTVVRQEQFAHDNYTISKRQFWYIPLTYINDGDDWSSPRKSWLKNEEKITLKDVGKRDDNKWVLFNVNQTGFYRVNYELDNWKLLSFALNSTFEKFPVTTRTSLVDDALSLAWGGRLEYPTALNLIRYLREKETHHSPWTVALKNMIKLNNLLQNTAAYSSFQEFMIKFISPIFEKVITESGESQMKLMAIEWACLIDNPECQNYLKNLSNVPTYLAKTHQCTLAKLGGKLEWDSLILKTSNTEDREMELRILAALPCFQVEWILQSLLTDILKGEKFDVGETLVLLQSFGENPMAARSAFKFVFRHWNEIFQRFSKSYQISKAFLVASINGIADEQDLKTFQIFKEEYYDKLKFMGHTIAVAEAEARSRSSWLKTNLLPVKTWLNDYLEKIS